MTPLDADSLDRCFTPVASALGAEGLDAGALAALRAVLRPRQLAPAEALTVEGRASDALLLLCEGEAAIEVSLGAGAPLELGRLGPGSLVGDVAFLDGRPASATVRALGPATALVVDRAAFASLRAEHPRAAAGLLQATCHALARRVALARDRLDALLAAAGAPPSGPAPSAAGDALRDLFGSGDR